MHCRMPSRTVPDDSYSTVEAISQTHTRPAWEGGALLLEDMSKILGISADEVAPAGQGIRCLLIDSAEHKDHGSIHLCGCVCVCERERGRGRGAGRVESSRHTYKTPSDVDVSYL